ncbi:hypothetical protein ACF1A9_16325 [Streptomyces sp. NPDC014872]|uniref:hypothetical protein n=1 Tax=unclassified Streptomyces TaxID=2593676 RepID=UPI0036FEACD7
MPVLDGSFRTLVAHLDTQVTSVLLQIGGDDGAVGMENGVRGEFRGDQQGRVPDTFVCQVLLIKP